MGSSRIAQWCSAAVTLGIAVALTACAAPLRVTPPPPPVRPAPSIEASTSVSDGIVGTLTGPAEIARGSSGEFRILVRNGSARNGHTRPSDWVLMFTGVTLRMATGPIYPNGWRTRPSEVVLLAPGASMELTYTVSLGRLASEWRVAPIYTGAKTQSSSVSATIRVR